MKQIIIFFGRWKSDFNENIDMTQGYMNNTNDVTTQLLRNTVNVVKKLTEFLIFVIGQ